MKRGFGTSICCIAIVFLLFFSSMAVADETTTRLVSSVVESFDPGDASGWTWELFPSKFGYDAQGNSMWELRYVEAWPEALFGKNKQAEDLKVLGLHGRFTRKGYNYVEIVPGEGEGADFQPKPLPLPGRVNAMDLWVWCSNFDYYLEAHVRDHQGIVHVLPLGSLRKIGWNNLSTIFPGSIPQATRYVPRTRPLELTKLVLWTRPNEKVDDYYVYFDQIKVLTDLFETRFDGDNLAEIDEVQKIWGQVTD
jgi:hypothetical protein